MDAHRPVGGPPTPSSRLDELNSALNAQVEEIKTLKALYKAPETDDNAPSLEDKLNQLLATLSKFQDISQGTAKLSSENKRLEGQLTAHKRMLEEEQRRSAELAAAHGSVGKCLQRLESKLQLAAPDIAGSASKHEEKSPPNSLQQLLVDLKVELHATKRAHAMAQKVAIQASSSQISHEVRSRLPPTSPVRHPLLAAESSAQDHHPRRHLSPHRIRGYSGQANGSPSRHASGALRRSVSAYTLSLSAVAGDNTGASRSENASPREHRSSADASPRLGGSPALDPTALVLLKKKHPPRRRLRASSSAAAPRHSPVIANEPVGGVGGTAVQEPALRQVKHGRRAGAHLSRSTSDTNLSSKLKLLYRSPTLQRATGQGGSGKSLRSHGSSSGGSANSILSIDSADSKQRTPSDELPSVAPRRGSGSPARPRVGSSVAAIASQAHTDQATAIVLRPVGDKPVPTALFPKNLPPRRHSEETDLPSLHPVGPRVMPSATRSHDPLVLARRRHRLKQQRAPALL